MSTWSVCFADRRWLEIGGDGSRAGARRIYISDMVKGRIWRVAYRAGGQTQ